MVKPLVEANVDSVIIARSFPDNIGKIFLYQEISFDIAIEIFYLFVLSGVDDRDLSEGPGYRSLGAVIDPVRRTLFGSNTKTIFFKIRCCQFLEQAGI